MYYKLINLYHDVRSWFKWCFTKYKYQLVKEAFKGQNWDYAYLLELEQAKMKEMLNYYENKVTWIDTTDIVRDLKLCIKLLDIITGKKEIYDVEWVCGRIEHKCLVNVNLRNYKRFFLEGDYKILQKYKEDLYMHKAWHLYHLIREYNMQKWWD